MITKLQPREMLHVSLVAKKLHEVIDYLNKLEEESLNEDTNNNTNRPEVSGQGDKESDKEKDTQDNQGGSE